MPNRMPNTTPKVKLSKAQIILIQGMRKGGNAYFSHVYKNWRLNATALNHSTVLKIISLGIVEQVEEKLLLTDLGKSITI